MRRHETFGGWNRLLSVPTLADALAPHVADPEPATDVKLSAWLHQLRLPAGWLPARFKSSLNQPARIAVCGSHPDGTWDAAETVSIVGLTGTPPLMLIQEASDRILRHLGVETARTYPLNSSPVNHASAVRGSGCLNVDGQRIWLQYSSYVVSSTSSGPGLLIEHGIFVDAAREADLRNDITKLTSTIEDVFVCRIEPASQQSVFAADSKDSGNLPSMNGVKMVVTFRVEPFEDMGDPAILVNADKNGMRMFQAAIRSAHKDGASSFEFDTVKHYVVRQDDAADIDLRPQTVVWRFDDTRLMEMLNLIEPLVNDKGPGHQYLDDLHSPVETLVLSVDEYTGRSVHYEFSQLLSTDLAAGPQHSTFVRVETTDDRQAFETETPAQSTPTQHTGNEPA